MVSQPGFCISQQSTVKRQPSTVNNSQLKNKVCRTDRRGGYSEESSESFLGGCKLNNCTRRTSGSSGNGEFAKSEGRQSSEFDRYP